jgi:hypothetical protein
MNISNEEYEAQEKELTILVEKFLIHKYGSLNKKDFEGDLQKKLEMCFHKLFMGWDRERIIEFYAEDLALSEFKPICMDEKEVDEFFDEMMDYPCHEPGKRIPPVFRYATKV